MHDRDGNREAQAAGDEAALWQRAGELFEAWLDLDATELAARIAQLRDADPALAAHVERLRVADASGGLLDRGVAAFSPTLADALGSDAAPVVTPALEPGVQFGPFRLLGLLGRGGMGDVYRAERVGAGYTQVVALKLLRPGAESEDLVRRFVQERRILAQLTHPGIARLIDGGMGAEGRPWLAMELVEGEPITDYARRHALGLRPRIALLIAVCEALDYAHRRLIVHRDLKPSNVLVGGDGAPRLLDFGIAKLLDQPEGDVRTGTGVRLLSPAYAAPEQVAGEPAGIATDVHALGLLLYELLTDDLPHGRRSKTLTALATSLESEPERPSVRRKRTAAGDTSIVARSLEGDIDTIVLKSLAHAPDRRYRSAAALADDLRRHLEGRPIAARPDTLSYRLGKFVRRHRGGVAVALASVVAIVVALVLALWQAGVARSEAAPRDARGGRGARLAARTRRVKDFMMATFAQADPFRNRPAGPQTLAEAVDDALARVDRDLGEDPRLQVDLLDDFGEVRTGQGRLDEAEALFRRSLALAEKTYGPTHPAVAESLVNLASIDIYKERFLQAAPNGERAIAILEQHADTEPLPLVNALGMMAVIRSMQGQKEEAVRLTERALALQRKYGAPNDPLLSAVMHNHGVNLSNAGRNDEAEPLLRESLALRERELGPDNPTLNYTLAALAQILYERGKYDEATALTERRVALARKAFPGDHAWKAGPIADLGWERVQGDRIPEGIALLEESIAMYTALDSSEVLTPLRYVALAHRRAGDAAAALAAIERAWQVCGSNDGLALCSVIRANRAGMLADAGRADEGLVEADAAIAELRAMDRNDDNDVGQALESRARALAALGRGAEAIATQKEALAIYVHVFGEEHSETKRVQARLATLEAGGQAPR
jgi:serine/threonine-protein kinase